MSNLPRPGEVNEWFPPVRQTIYVNTIAGQFGLTRKQATYFVRLWAYASLQQSEQAPPISTLYRSVNTFPCSHRDAADLFYCDSARGSERSAGMMLDQLITKNLVRREPFDGGPTRLSLQIPSDFLPAMVHSQTTRLSTDAFDVRQDAARVAAFLEDLYGWVNQCSEMMTFNIIKVLRRWASQNPDGLRVLRTVSDDELVGFAAFYPTHPDSEKNFHLPPSNSLYLATLVSDDPIQIATPGDEACYGVFVRAWWIKPSYWNYSTVCQFLQDAQATLRNMQKTYPNLCDMYSIAIHPELERLSFHLGFKVMKADSGSSLRWVHLSLDRFLALDIDEVLVEFDFSSCN